MPKKNFLLLSLEDEQAKKVANIVSNESCRKILDFLADKEGTESEISTALDIPLSTVHYNLQQLTKGGLVEADEYHYSKKGKEILHYKLANKYIIIAPKKVSGLATKLKSILPVFLITAGAAGILQWSQKFFPSPLPTTLAKSTPLAPEAASIQEAADSDTASRAFQEQPGIELIETTSTITSTGMWENIALWFFIGAVFALVVLLLISITKRN